MTEQSEGERLYILGHPVAHSKSPVMYNALYEKLGLPWTYALADYAELDDARCLFGCAGFSVRELTTPYKPLAFQAQRARLPARSWRRAPMCSSARTIS